MATGGLLREKRALVVGLLNKHSLAASITHSLLAHGASCVVASRSPLSDSQIKACAFELPFADHHKNHHHADGSPRIDQTIHFTDCDVETDESIAAMMDRCGEAFNGELDILVHSVAFAPRETFQAKGTLMATRAAWNQALDVSAYSLIALTRAAHPLLSAGEKRDRSVLALSYGGASKVVPNYNVMGPAKAALEATARQLAYELGEEGIRVNCLSPGPMNTVSARGIPGISRMRKYAEEHSPLRRNATGTEVGELAAFLASNAASSITGQTLYELIRLISSITTETIAWTPQDAENDPNASLGVHLSDLDAERPPNLFMYPRSFINMHREGSFYPFLAVYPPQLLQFVQPNPITESCAGKFFLSATMGYAMGNVFGLVLGSYEGITPPIPVPGQRELPKVPWREAMVGSWRVTKGKCRYWGNNFLVISSMFSGLECAVEKARGVHDVGNELVAGCATGAALAAGQGWQAQCLGCGGFAAFSYAIHKFTDGKF